MHNCLSAYALQIVHATQLILHFFVVQLTEPQFLALEKSALDSTEYGDEVCYLFSIRAMLHFLKSVLSKYPIQSFEFLSVCECDAIMATEKSEYYTYYKV